MSQPTLILDVPSDFSFWRTVLSHGWCTLPPFFLDRPARRLLRVLQLASQPALARCANRGMAESECGCAPPARSTAGT